MHTIQYTVDGEPQETQDHKLAPSEILRRANVDPATHYLKELSGQSNNAKSYEQDPSTPIPLHPNQRFVSVPIGPTTVS